MIGLRLTVKRAGQKPTTKGNDTWINAVSLSR